MKTISKIKGNKSSQKSVTQLILTSLFTGPLIMFGSCSDTVNEELEVDWNWYSSDPDVFTVEAGGTATGHKAGEAHCIVEAELVAEKLKVKSKFVPIGLDSASVTLLN